MISQTQNTIRIRIRIIIMKKLCAKVGKFQIIPFHAILTPSRVLVKRAKYKKLEVYIFLCKFIQFNTEIYQKSVRATAGGGTGAWINGARL